MQQHLPSLLLSNAKSPAAVTKVLTFSNDPSFPLLCNAFPAGEACEIFCPIRVRKMKENR